MEEGKVEVTPEVRGHLDRGWSWVVLAATFVAFFIMQGQLLTGNIYFIVYLREFQEPRSITALTAAAYTATVNLTGPVSSVLLRKLGPRFLVMVGGLIMASGFLCIAPSPNIGQVIFGHGMVRGIGASFIMNGCQASLAKYFSKRLYVATGIMYSASCIGMMVIGLLTEYMIDAYGWRGSLVIQAGLTIHICLCGALVFKVPTKNRASAQLTNGLHQEPGGVRTAATNGLLVLPATKNSRWPWRTSKDPEALRRTRIDNDEATSNNLLRQTEVLYGVATTKTLTDETESEDRATGNDQKSRSDDGSRTVSFKDAEAPRRTGVQDDEAVPRNLLQGSEDLGGGASTKTQPDETGSDNRTTSNDQKPLPPKSGSDDGKRGRPSPRVFMRDARFWCISCCTTMLYMFTSVVIVFWKDILPHKNDFKVALLAMAVGSTLGRGTAGFVSNRIAPPLHQCIVSTLNALVILGFLVSDQVWVVAVHNFAWGFLNGQQTVADRLQLAWVYGRLDMPIVLGFSLIFVGVGGFMAPPLAGFITDSTGSYLGTLLMTSAFSASGAAFSLALYFLHKKRLAEDEQKKKLSSDGNEGCQ